MGKEHRLAERRQAIVSTLQEFGQLSVADLSTRFNVSEVTIRADLQALSEQGLLLRTRGGALATTVLPELSFDIRQQQYADRKARIGKAAAALVKPGDTIAIDASTTAQAMIPYLDHLAELTVVTNSLRAATSFLRSPQVHVIVPGGSLRRESISLVGEAGCDFIGSIHISIGFYGARGITPNEGLTDVNLEEVKTKHALVERCQRVVAMVDSRKWGQVATSTFAPVNSDLTIITDDGAPPDLVEAVRRQGAQVLLV